MKGIDVSRRLLRENLGTGPLIRPGKLPVFGAGSLSLPSALTGTFRVPFCHANPLHVV